MVGSLICCGSCTSWRVALPSKPSSATCSLWNFVLRQSKPLQIESYLPAGLEISICSRYYILCFSAIDYRRCFAFNFFYQLSSLLCLLLTFYRLVESLNFTFVRVESAQWHGLPKLTSFRFSYAILLLIMTWLPRSRPRRTSRCCSTGNNNFSTHKFHLMVNTAKILVHPYEK